MDPLIRFHLACSKHSINLSTPSSPSTQLSMRTINLSTSTFSSLQPSIALIKLLNEFHLFPLLPFEIRSKIWKLAVKAIPPRLIYFRPHPSNNPGLAHACYESRREVIISNLFWRCTSNSNLSRVNFSVMINYDTDLLYLDRRVIRSRNPDNNPIPTTILMDKNWLRPVRQLAINLRDTRAFLPFIWGPSSWHKGRDLWHILGGNCPDLMYLWIIDNGPFEEGYGGELIHDNHYQVNRSYQWNTVWAQMHQDLMIAKLEGVLSKKVFMRPMDMNKVGPLPLLM